MVNPRQYLIGRIKENKILLKWALRAYSIKNPPPYRRTNMEFESDSWAAVSSLHCWNGRQIGEDNSGPYPYREISGNIYETCRFSDSRNGLPMNVTNLRLVMPVAKDAYGLLTALRNMYIIKRQLDSSRFNLIQSYLFSKLALSLPAYLTRRKHNPLGDGRLGAAETAVYMVGTAPYLLVRQLMVRGDATPLHPHPLTGQKLYELADSSGVLISLRRKACPASSKLICELFDVMMNGSYEGETDSPEILRALDEMGNWEQFYAYTLAASRLELLVKLSQALTAKSLLELGDDGGLSNIEDYDMLKRVAKCALDLSHAKIVEEKDSHHILGNIIDVLYALLLDHGEGKTVKELSLPHCLNSPDAAIENRIGCDPQVIRRRYETLNGACRRNLLAVHHALGHSEWPCFNDHDFFERAGGSELRLLLPRL